MNNKGSSVTDVILVVVLLLAFGLASILALMVFNGYNDNYQAKDNVYDNSKEMIQDNVDSYVNVIDPIALLIVIGLTIALIVGASMINTHPALFIVALIITSITIFLAAVYSNAYTEIASNSALVTTESQFTVLPTIMNNLPVIVTVMALLVALTLYSRTRGGEL